MHFDRSNGLISVTRSVQSQIYCSTKLKKQHTSLSKYYLLPVKTLHNRTKYKKILLDQGKETQVHKVLISISL